MAHPNVKTIERAYAAFAEGDIATIMSLWADDVAWHTSGDNPLANDYEGKDAVAGFLGALVQTTAGSFRAELQNVLADDTNGYSLHKATATIDGEDLEDWAVLGYRFRDGKISEIWTFDYDQRISDRVLGG
jgi:hypothetical protein